LTWPPAALSSNLVNCIVWDNDAVQIVGATSVTQCGRRPSTTGRYGTDDAGAACSLPRIHFARGPQVTEGCGNPPYEKQIMLAKSIFGSVYAFALAALATMSSAQGPCNLGQPPCIPRWAVLDNNVWATLDNAGGAGSPWETLKSWSDMTLPSYPNTPDINTHTSNDDMIVLACAMRYKSEGNSFYKTRAEDALSAIKYTENTTLQPWNICRNLPGFVLAADILDYNESSFRSWVWGLRLLSFGGETFEQFHKRRPNNQGLAVGLARVAIAIYYDGGVQGSAQIAYLVDAKNVFHFWLGNTSLPDPGFEWDGNDIPPCMVWSDTPSSPVGINPLGAVVNSQNVDGCLPDDQRRIFDCDTSPFNNSEGCSEDCVDECGVVDSMTIVSKTNYTWESMQCVVMTAHLLDRCLYNPFRWEDEAIRRAIDWLYDVNVFPPEDADNSPACIGGGSTSDDTWVPFITDAHYFTYAPRAALGTEDDKPGKVFGFSAWWAPGI
jgi:hypothetical protein